MVKYLVALGWLRDLVIVFLVIAGMHLRHTSPAIGVSIIAAGAVVFIERFLWSWHLCDLRDAARPASPAVVPRAADPEAE